MKTLIGISILGMLMNAALPLRAAEYFASTNCQNRGGAVYETSTTFASSGCANSIDYPGFVTAGAEAADETLHADAHGDGHLDAEAVAVMSDNYLVSAGPGQTGASGSIVFTYYVHGVSTDPHAMGRVLVTVDSTAVYTDPSAAIAFIQYIAGADSVASQGAMGVAFEFGVAQNIETGLTLSSENGEINFDSTVELVGIQAFDSAGKPVSATITGDGGFDYSALAASNAAALGLDVSGVPESSTWAMMLVGFAGLAFAGRQAARRALA
jgi:hypothetical protein